MYQYEMVGSGWCVCMLRVSVYARTEETGSNEHENSPGSPKDEEGAGKTPQQTLAEQVKFCIILFYNYKGCCLALTLTVPCLGFRIIPKLFESYTASRLALALPLPWCCVSLSLEHICFKIISYRWCYVRKL
jgi:hypothetical protein